MMVLNFRIAKTLPNVKVKNENKILLCPLSVTVGRCTMTIYRMYFLGSYSNRIICREDFAADNDITALRIARILCDACSDKCQSFELWQGRRRVRARQPPYHRVGFDDLSEAAQCAVIDVEERIRQSTWMLARSQRLLERLEQKAAVRSRCSTEEAKAV
jgi:hypothetical protein